MHGCDIAHIPPTDVFIECRSAVSALDISVTAETFQSLIYVGGVSFCLVIKPKIDCFVEIGVVNYDILPPVVWPIWVGGEGRNGSSFV